MAIPADVESPLRQVNQEIPSAAQDDAIFWWNALSQPMASLFQTNNYSAEQQLYYLRWFRQWIMPALGPQPNPADGKPHYGAWLTHDGSRLEYSLNWKEKKHEQTIRFTIEPASREAGTPADPLNQKAAKKLLTDMAKALDGIDLTRFDIFHDETRVPDDAADEIIAKNPPGAPLTGTWVAFDLERGAIVAKAYFLPHLKAIWSGIPTKTIVFDAIRRCNGPLGSYDAPIAALDAYLESFPAADAPQVVLLANDCVVDSPASRSKVYVHPSVPGSLAAAKDMFNLGGRLTGPATAKGLEAISDLWCLLFGLDRADPASEEKVVLPDGRKFLCVYEMRPTQEGQESQAGPDIEVKLHIPGWHLGKTDEEVNGLLEKWFSDHGHDDLAARYRADLASTFPKHNLGADSGTHTWISLTWTEKTGLYMTMYYTPKLPEFYFGGN
ncbi:4-O-dimethylallyl-L-tyrosine synthase [Colletotrichum higginsianum]|uniref:4-O-dimethylallyl-L-tyrosine synthase n=1 Tax=Colletotrichum higginsianum TaxID=80884 RepID=A0A4T0W3H0_9PEZI|nr:4-O-dimethylallyl-L-tyrosine synthase [Colletotrichum higginsianum]